MPTVPRTTIPPRPFAARARHQARHDHHLSAGQSGSALCVLVTLIGTVLAQPAAFAASMTGRDAQVLMRALSFFSPPRGPAACVAVAFAPGDSGSRADAEAMVALFAGLPGAPCARTFPTDGLHGTEGSAAIIAAQGAPVDDVMAAARTQHIPCVTTGLALVEAGRCTMWVHADPRVEIVVNHASLVSAGISLAAAFRMMIREK